MTEQMQKAKDLFKKFCYENNQEEGLKNSDWYDLSLGFFMALGLSFEDSEKLACDVRYKEHYWC